jgi:hypothetical protein
MVDLVEIGLTVDSSDFVKAAADTKGFELAVAKMVQTILRENRVLKASSKASADARAEAEQRSIQKQIEANQKLTATKEREAAKQKAILDRQAKAEMDAYVKTTIAAEKAAAAKAKTVQANVGGNLGLGAVGVSAGASASAISAEVDRLRLKYDQIYASSKLYESALNELNRAEMLGVISDKQRQASLTALNSQMANGTGIFANYSQQIANNANRMGVVMQQTGYQVSDFIVQVQSGTNPMVAFGQQATQLAGMLYYLPPAALASTVSILGLKVAMTTLIAGFTIVIPLLTALAMVFMKTSSSAKEAKEELSDLDASIKNIDSSLKKWTQTKQAAAEGMTVEQMFGGQSLAQAKTDLGVALRLAEQIQEETRNTTGLDAALLNSIESIWGGGIINRLNAATAEVEKAKQRIIDINAKLVEEQKQNSDDSRVALQNEFDMQMSIAKFGEDSAQTKALANKQALDDYNRQIDAQVRVNELTEEQGSKLKAANLLNTYLLDITQKLVAAEEKKEQVLIRSYKYMGETMRLSAEQVAAYERENSALDNRLVMETTIAKFGRDSAEVKKLQLENELDLYNKGIDAQVIAGTLDAERAAALKDYNRTVQEAIALAEKTAEEEAKKAKAMQAAADKATLLKNIFHAMAGEAGAVSVELDGWAGKLIAAANASTGLQDFLLKQRIDTGMKGRGLPADYYSMDTAPIDTGSLFGNIEFGPTGAVIKTEDKTKTGADKKDPLVELQKQIALQEELNGKTEAEKRVRQALGESFATYSPIVIKGLEDQIQKQIELEERLKEQQGLYDTIQSSMEDAFMSMVDGTKSAKDAFKSMAAAIIKELYNVLVVQQLVGSFDRATGKGAGITGFLGKALTGMFKADGGPVSAGQPYIVGERGPELIIPKSSGMVLTNGQTKAALGGSSNESYVVNNNISVTGSDSVMVRQEIAKMIPQISSATKAAMIDAKRRGGQMGNAFR